MLSWIRVLLGQRDGYFQGLHLIKCKDGASLNPSKDLHSSVALFVLSTSMSNQWLSKDSVVSLKVQKSGLESQLASVSSSVHVSPHRHMLVNLLALS